MSEIQQFLNSLIKDPAEREKFEFYYVEGHTSFHGRTTISIKFTEYLRKDLPPGNLPETIDENKKTEIKKFQLSAEAVNNFIRGLINEKIWELKNCKEFGVPDETQANFYIKKGDHNVWEATIWHNCIYQDKRAKAIYKLMTEIVLK